MSDTQTVGVRECHVQINTANQSRFVYEDKTASMLLRTCPPRATNGGKLFQLELRSSQGEKTANVRVELDRQAVLKLIDYAITNLELQAHELGVTQ